LLLATEPIWEDDSFDLGVNPGIRGMEISTGQRAVAGSGIWESPCKASGLGAPLLRDQASINSTTRQSRLTEAVENLNPVRAAKPGEGRAASGHDPLSRPCTSATTSKITARSFHDRTLAASLEPVAEQPAYTGMTGRRDRRDRFNPPPEVASQRRHTRQRTELDCRESGSEQGPRPTTDRRGENGEGSKRRREASPVESVPVKKGEPSNTVALLLRTTRPEASWDF
jgi:hypothetical protein